MKADLKDLQSWRTALPIGTMFWYLHRRMVVIGHDPSTPECSCSIQTHYADDDGIIRSIYFESPAFDYIVQLVREQAAEDREHRD